MRAYVADAAPRAGAGVATEEWQAKMHQIEQCRHCGHCMAKCPYGLNTPELLQAYYKYYWEVLAQSRK